MHGAYSSILTAGLELQKHMALFVLSLLRMNQQHFSLAADWLPDFHQENYSYHLCRSLGHLVMTSERRWQISVIFKMKYFIPKSKEGWGKFLCLLWSNTKEGKHNRKLWGQSRIHLYRGTNSVVRHANKARASIWVWLWPWVWPFENKAQEHWKWEKRISIGHRSIWAGNQAKLVISLRFPKLPRHRKARSPADIKRFTISLPFPASTKNCRKILEKQNSNTI